MALTSDEKRAIIAYRIDKAHKTMIEAYDNAKMEHWSLAAKKRRPLHNFDFDLEKHFVIK